MQEFQEYQVSQIRDLILNGGFEVGRLNLRFDANKYRQMAEMALGRFPARIKDRYEAYKGLGLQYSDPANPLYDSVGEIVHIDSKKNAGEVRWPGLQVKKNQIGESFGEIYSIFERFFLLSRGRLLVAEPGFKMSEHTDGEHCLTLHLPLKTDPQAYLYVEGRAYHLPADGSIYIVNVSKPHYIWNQSSLERIHLTFPLTPLNFYNWSLVEFEKLKSFFQTFGLRDISQFTHLKVGNSGDI